MNRILIFEDPFPGKSTEDLSEEQKRDIECHYGLVARWIADTQDVTPKLSYPLKA